MPVLTREQYSRKQTLDLETAIAAAVARAIDREYPGPGGKGIAKLSAVFDEWPDFEDRYVSPSACVLPDDELKYVTTANNMTVVPGSWEKEGEPGLGLFLLAEAQREFEIIVRADTPALRAALKAGIEAAFVEDRISIAPLTGTHNSLIVPMPEYWGLECSISLLGSRKTDDAELAARRVRECRFRVLATAPHVKLGIVQPFRPRVRILEELPDGTLQNINATRPVGVVTPDPDPDPDPDPVPPPEGMLLWLQGDVELTNDGVNATAWADQSGNGNDVTVPAGATAPLYVASGIGDIPGVDFAGVGQALGRTGTSLIAPGADRSVFVVCRPNDTGFAGGGAVTFRTSSKDWCAFLFGNSGTQFIWSDAVIAINTVTPEDYTGDAILMEWEQVSLVLSFTVNGDAKPLSGTATSVEDGAPGFTIGNRAVAGYSQFLDARVCEVFVYDRILSADEKDDLRAYVNSRFPSIPA